MTTTWRPEPIADVAAATVSDLRSCVLDWLVNIPDVLPLIRDPRMPIEQIRR
jgi:hypothetical protein